MEQNCQVRTVSQFVLDLTKFSHMETASVLIITTELVLTVLNAQSGPNTTTLLKHVCQFVQNILFSMEKAVNVQMDIICSMNNVLNVLMGKHLISLGDVMLDVISNSLFSMDFNVSASLHLS